MKLIGLGAAAVLVMVAAAMARPEVKVEISGLHLCCQGCEGAAVGALTGAGAKATADRPGKKITLTASNEKQAQKALDALAAAGFHGTTDSKVLLVKEDSGANIGAKGKPVMVTSLTLKGAHNCCDACNKALKEAISKVEGVASEDAKSKETTFTVKGNYEAAKLVQAINDAGYHVKVDKAERAK